MTTIVQAVCLAVAVAAAYLNPTPITVGCSVLIGALFLVSLAREVVRR